MIKWIPALKDPNKAINIVIDFLNKTGDKNDYFVCWNYDLKRLPKAFSKEGSNNSFSHQNFMIYFEFFISFSKNHVLYYQLHTYT